MAIVEDTFRSKSGDIIRKVINDDGDVSMVEAFVNSEDDTEYNIYTLKDGGVVEMTTDNLSKSKIRKLYFTALDSIVKEID